ncbi:Translation machinery-associated protein 22 [Friedmanniomyces endolithicus]|uniref:Translation machinery-associated protein 22 n=2 Tax=Dothideomycetidae TaxID=451867 RepID=A0A4U0UN47_9PEZI|nr:Translation machinery-associated protein 22 [Friedmanniomyces endolithicus]KAK5148644.1 Translation machinery-associated protein 22 [Rachicladosporium monterosium]KAK0270878.1 Translation machinery-associated protein 22 [Friedmanniomyces endolithicus]KAK0273988.1 Translation machinery-associated protein 22 [Friedmanniomyces endolithicus]KAK0313335.1 Translation machinery-associated protein 22 [Friedmanniomyces endolithicus]
MADTATATDARPPKHVVYCGVCTLPPEYCEYGGTTKKCSDWLLANHPDLHSHLYSEDAATKGMSNLSLDAQKRADKDAQKKAAKAEAAEAREKTARAASKVYIKRVERNKRKYVTEVSGLEAFGLDLKKIAKEFGKKFATGSSVTKNAGGTGDEITVQGDVSEDIFDWLQEHHGEIPEDNIELIEDKKKKASAGP